MGGNVDDVALLQKISILLVHVVLYALLKVLGLPMVEDVDDEAKIVN